MSSNVTFLALGMVLAGRLTEAFGPRWVWGAAAVLSSVAAVVGFTLARGAAKAPVQAAEAPETPVEPEPAVEEHSRARQRAV
jgi:MFS family permease